MLTTTFAAYPGSTTRPIGYGSARAFGSDAGSITFEYILQDITPTLKAPIEGYPGIESPTAPAVGSVAVEAVGGGTIKVHYNLDGLNTAVSPTAGPIATTIGAYPDATSDYVPEGTVAVSDSAGGSVVVMWSLSSIKPTLKGSLGVFPGSSTSPPSGTVFVEDQVDGSLKLYYTMEGFPVNSTGGPAAGIHIHVGKSCADPNLQTSGLHFKEDASGQNPWVDSHYTIEAGKAKGTIEVNSGYTFHDNEGRVVIVHNDQGHRIACSVLAVAYGGVHIHTGMSCANAGNVGGHYWKDTNSTDPWTSAYNSGKTTSNGVATVASGYQFTDNVGHAVVVHAAADGSRIGCGVLGAAASLHVHTGASCLDSNGVGGHYYDKKLVGDADPWTGIAFPVSDDGNAKGSFEVATGYIYEENEGHAVVVHAQGGDLVGCGVLAEATGGIHIHSGLSCDTDSEVGGHYWMPSDARDPWNNLTYTTRLPSTAGSTVVDSGYPIDMNTNHAVVVHSAIDGSRILCGVLELQKLYPDGATALTASMDAYPGAGSNFSGDVTVVPVDIDDANAPLRVEFTLDGLDTSTLKATMRSYPGYTESNTESVYGSVSIQMTAARDPTTDASGLGGGVGESNAATGLWTTFTAYPGIENPTAASGIARVVGGRTLADPLTFQYKLENVPRTLASSIEGYPGLVEPNLPASGTVKVEDVGGGGEIKVHYDLSNLNAESLASAGPLAAKIGGYPGASPDYAPVGTASVTASVTNGAFDLRWSLSGLKPTLKATLVKYPGAIGPQPTGTVHVEDQPDGSLKVYYDLAGFDGNVVVGSLHVHSGKSCTLHELVGGHYWSTELSPDPWLQPIFNVQGDVSKGSFSLTSGYTIAANTKHAVVIHNDDGDRIACGILEPAKAGIHIHEGLSCDTDAGVKGHYWKDASKADPWITTLYDAAATTASGTVTVNSGFTTAENFAHAVVVHSAAGTPLLYTDYRRSPLSARFTVT
jgi:hypothetical protein